MECRGNLVSKIVNWGEVAKKLSEGGTDGNKKSVPDEKFDDGEFGNFAFFPGNFGVEEISDDSSNRGGNKGGKPDEVVVFDDEIGNNRIENIIESGNTEANDEIPGGMARSFDVIMRIHIIIIPHGQKNGFEV